MASPGKNSGQRVAKDGVLCGPDMNRPCWVCTSMFDDDTLRLIGLQQTIGRSLVKNGVDNNSAQVSVLPMEIPMPGSGRWNDSVKTYDVAFACCFHNLYSNYLLF